MMRRAFLMFFSGLVLVCLTGMGNLGGPPEGKTPETKENIRVRLTDASGVVTELSHFSMDGRVFLDGTRGQSRLMVPLREIRKIEVEEVSGDEAVLALTLASSESVPLTIRKLTTFFGDTGYGALQVQAKDVRQIEVMP